MDRDAERNQKNMSRRLKWILGIAGILSAVAFALFPILVPGPRHRHSKSIASDCEHGVSTPSTLRTLVTVLITYSNTYITCPPSLADMGPPPPGEPLSSRSAGLIGAELASGISHGYKFQLSCNSSTRAFTISADPLENSGYTDHFFVDETIIIRRETGVPATVNSLFADAKCWPNTPAGLTGSIDHALWYFNLVYHTDPESLAQLGPPPKGQKPTERAANLIDRELASGQRLGYIFRYRQTEGGGFELNADPATEPGSSAFFRKAPLLDRQQGSSPSSPGGPSTSHKRKPDCAR